MELTYERVSFCLELISIKCNFLVHAAHSKDNSHTYARIQANIKSWMVIFGKLSEHGVNEDEQQMINGSGRIYVKRYNSSFKCLNKYDNTTSTTPS